MSKLTIEGAVLKAFWHGSHDLPESLKKKLSVEDIRNIYRHMVQPTLDANLEELGIVILPRDEKPEPGDSVSVMIDSPRHLGRPAVTGEYIIDKRGDKVIVSGDNWTLLPEKGVTSLRITGRNGKIAVIEKTDE